MTFFCFFAVVFAFLAASYARRYHLSLFAAMGIYCCFVWLLATAFAPGTMRGKRLRPSPWLLLPFWLGPYFLYVLTTRDFSWTALARLVLIAVPAVALYALVPVRELDKLSWRDILVAALLMSLVLSHGLAHIWNRPVNLDFMSRLFVIAVGAGCWVYVRPVPGFGYELRLSPQILKYAALYFGVFAVAGIPLGFALHFTAWNPRWKGPVDFASSFLEIFLFIALLEELFFRGFLQTLFSNTFGSWWKGQLLASCLFGLSHILHAPFPNWRYVILASIAGWCYGLAFRSGGTVVASALTHAAVDTVWRTWFTK